jgi:hypothetical protein
MLHIPPLPSRGTNSHTTTAWGILEEFATMDMTLPQAENALKDHFGDQYVDGEWRPALDAVMVAENDVAAALKSLQKLQHTSGPASSTDLIPLHASTPQCTNLKAELMASIEELKDRNQIFRPLPTIEEVISPPEE